MKQQGSIAELKHLSAVYHFYIGISWCCLNTVVMLYACSSPVLSNVKRMAGKPWQCYWAWKLSFSSQFCYYQFKSWARRRLLYLWVCICKMKVFTTSIYKAVMEKKDTLGTVIMTRKKWETNTPCSWCCVTIVWTHSTGSCRSWNRSIARLQNRGRSH